MDKQIKKYLENATPEELKDIKGRIDLLLMSKKPSKDDPNIELFYSIVASYVRTKISVKLPDLSIVKKTRKQEYSLIVTALNSVNEYLTNILQEATPTKTQLSMGYKLYAKFILTYLIDNEYAVSLTTLFSFYSVFMTKMEKEFPGYLFQYGSFLFKEDT